MISGMGEFDNRRGRRGGGTVCPKSIRSAGIMDGMNRIDRMTQTHIQILCIL
ncbi:MAG: hypothetical protein GQ533_09950 [Methanosarcinaceae archaeon]|nr:hypothetical protein [Methanosarcinaceae archaeon]